MQLIFANPEHTTIKVTLDEGETLGNQHGPVECFVPLDPANVEYAAILAGEYQIEPYSTETPTDPPPETFIG